MYIVWVPAYLNLSIHIPTLYPRGLNYNNNMEAFFHNFEIMFILSSEISVFIIICSSRFHNVQKWFSHEFLFHDFFLLIWKWKITMLDDQGYQVSQYKFIECKMWVIFAKCVSWILKCVFKETCRAYLVLGHGGLCVSERSSMIKFHIRTKNGSRLLKQLLLSI